MQRIVINACYGGFGLSHEGMMAYAKKKGIKLYAFLNKRDSKGHTDFNSVVPYKPSNDKNGWDIIHYSTKPLLKDDKYDNDAYFGDGNIERNDPALVEVVEELGEKSFGHCAKLKVVEVPDGVKWQIDEYDGHESVEEAHQSWS